MGRNKIYKTEIDRLNAERKRKLRWYYRNSDKVKKANMNYYWRKKSNEKINNK